MKGGKQCMKFGLEMINHIIDKIYKEELPYTDSIIIGENSSGKTLLLKLFTLLYNFINDTPVS